MYKYEPNIHIDQVGPILATVSIVIILGLAGLYFYAAKFYRDIFYGFLSVGWLANAAYVLFEFFFTSPERNSTYLLETYGLGVLSTLPFYLATFISVDGASRKRKISTSLLKWIGWLACTFLFYYWITQENLLSVKDGMKFVVLSIGGTTFAVWSLFRVGRCFRIRLVPEIYGNWSFLLPASFYLYAMAQPLYLIKMIPSTVEVVTAIFISVYAIKVTNIIGILSILRIDLVRLEEQAHVLHEQSQRRSQLEDLGALTASIGHDLRTPLGIINLEIKMMKGKFQSNYEVVSGLEHLEDQARRIYAVTQIISIFRGSKDYFESFMEKANVTDLINHCIKDIKKEMGIQNITFRTERKAFYIKANLPMMEQVIINILKNSVEAIREAKRRSGLVNITLRKEVTSEKRIRVDITDNGCGIPEDNIPKLATLFTTKGGRKPNSGIGLFIANRIMKLHSGELQIRSTVGQGSTVSLLLPLWDSQVESEDSLLTPES
jgi:signal transduction histidine kinase